MIYGIYGLCAVLIGIRLLLLQYAAPLVVAGDVVHFTTVIVSEPNYLRGRNGIWVQYGDFWRKERLYVYYQDVQLRYGDTVEISGTLKEQVLSNGTKRKTLPEGQIVKLEDKRHPVLALTEWIRQKATHTVEGILPRNESALVLGMVLGMKGDFSQSFLGDLRTAGVLHVIAASGTNVTMVGGLLFGLLGRVLDRKKAVVLSMGGIMGYVVLAGMQPSIVRAGIMGAIACTAQLLGRQYAALHALIVTACIMIVYDPLYLTDVGFQLSVAATMGIILLSPLFPGSPLWQDISMTTSAQAATLPIIAITFNQIGAMGLLANVLVLWTVPPIMIFGAAAILIGMLWQGMATVLLWMILPLLWWFIMIVSWIGDMTWAVLPIPDLPPLVWIGYTLILVALVVWKHGKS